MASRVEQSWGCCKKPTDLKLDASKGGDLEGRAVVPAKNQTSKTWFIVAVVVGSLVVVGVGGLGITGLLQSHGVIHLSHSSQWLLSAIGTVGNTPNFWSLWTMAIGGVVVGGALITVGASKIHTIRMEAKQEARVKEEESAQEQLRLRKEAEAAQADSAALAAAFSENNFSVLKLKSDDHATLARQTYTTRHFFGRWDGDNPATRKFIRDARPDKNFIVIRTDAGSLQCTARITQEMQDELVAVLKRTGYTPA